MNIIVFSDSHGDVESMQRVLLRERPDAFFHLGDHYADAQALASAFPAVACYAVMGNTDFAGNGEKELLLTLEGQRMLLAHGHLHNVKNGLTSLWLRGRESGASLLLFGHTHRPLLTTEQGVTLLNPGACSLYGRGNQPTYARVRLGAQGADCRILPLFGQNG